MADDRRAGGAPALEEGFDRRSRADEPPFEDAAQAARWRTARRAAIDHVLALISECWWSDELVLRGSYTLQAWLGDPAREPADLDWVVVENTDDSHDVWQYGDLADLDRKLPVLELCADADDSYEDAWYVDLLARIKERPQAPGGVVLDADDACMDGLDSAWYYHNWGVRVAIPWQAPGVPPGKLLMDFSWEPLATELLETAALPVGGGGRGGRRVAVVRTPTRELALAWKLLWQQIESDEHDHDRGARGKDLYDAVLLAEDSRTNLTTSLFSEIASDFQDGQYSSVGPDDIRGWTVDWDAFQNEHPWVAGSAQDWQERLFSALTSMFAAPPTVENAHSVEVGDSVTITGGPFRGILATVAEADASSNRAKAVAWIFGRETMIELACDQMRKN